MCRRFVLLLLVCVFAGPLRAESVAERLVARAIAAIGGEAALDAAMRMRVVYIGNEDLDVVYQGATPAVPGTTRRAETLVLDAAAGRSADRHEGVSADGNPAMWLNVTQGDRGMRLNIKTQRLIASKDDEARELHRNRLWRVPHHALREMRANPTRSLRVQPVSVRGVEYDAIAYEVHPKVFIDVLFDRETGRLGGYRSSGPYVLGPTTTEFLFKRYRPAGTLGMFPSGIQISVGGGVYRDLDVYDVRPSRVAEDSWLTRPIPDLPPILRIVRQEPKAEPIAPHAYLLRNMIGYNVLVADIGECLVMVDAPAHVAVPQPLPNASASPVAAPIIRQKLAEVAGKKKVCYVVPTHHHADHLTGLVDFARAGATVLTTEGNVDLVRRMIGATARVETVADRRVLGEGDRRIEIWKVAGDPHAGDTLFAYLPGPRIAFEADITDYVLSAKHFLQFVEDRGLKIDRLYGAHNGAFAELWHLEDDDPSN